MRRYTQYPRAPLTRSGTSQPMSASSSTVAPPRPELADVGRLWRRVLHSVVAKARADTPPTAAEVLARHLGSDSGHLPVLEERWAGYDHVNLQAAVDAWLAEAGRSAELVGIGDRQLPMTGLAALLGAGGDEHQPRIGSVARVSVASGPGGATRSCMSIGLYLVTDGPHRTAMLLLGPTPEFGRPFVTLELVTTDPDGGARIGREIRELALAHNVFRRQVLGFGGEVFGPESALLSFHERPRLPAAELILRPEALAAIERQVVQVSRYRDRLRPRASTSSADCCSTDRQESARHTPSAT